jgi:hypothetical protein
MTVPITRLGTVGGRSLRLIAGKGRASLSLRDMRKAWSGTLPRLMG